MRLKLTHALSIAALGAATLAMAAQPGPRAGRKAHGPTAAPIKQREDGLRWSLAAGRPDIQPGHSSGFYVWHEGSTVYVVSTDESDKGQQFGGHIQVKDGVINDVKAMKLEKDDHLAQPKPNVVNFRFKTMEATDGVSFELNGGKRLRLNLRFAGQPTVHIFFGSRMVEAPRDPVVFDLDK